MAHSQALGHQPVLQNEPNTGEGHTIAMVKRSRLQWAIGGLGVVVACAGVAVLFTTDHNARSAFLLTLGLVLMLVAWFGGRIQLESFEILGAKARVRDVVKTRLELARASESTGADSVALHRQAAVLRELVGLYGLYEHVRGLEPAGPRRTAALDEIASRMQSAGAGAEFEAAEVIGWFHDGTDPLRVVALNLMLANAEYRDFLAVLETIGAPHSLFEQFYGLRLAEAMLPDLDPLHRRLLADAIERAGRKRRVKRDAPLMHISQNLLDRLGKQP